MKLKFQFAYIDDVVLEFRHKFGPWTIYVGPDPEFLGSMSASCKDDKTTLLRDIDKEIRKSWKPYRLKKL